MTFHEYYKYKHHYECYQKRTQFEHEVDHSPTDEDALFLRQWAFESGVDNRTDPVVQSLAYSFSEQGIAISDTDMDRLTYHVSVGRVLAEMVQSGGRPFFIMLPSRTITWYVNYLLRGNRSS